MEPSEEIIDPHASALGSKDQYDRLLALPVPFDNPSCLYN